MQTGNNHKTATNKNNVAKILQLRTYTQLPLYQTLQNTASEENENCKSHNSKKICENCDKWSGKINYSKMLNELQNHNHHAVVHKSTTITTILWPFFPGPPGWVGARRELMDFMVQGEINRGRHTDHPAGRHSIRTNQCPPPLSPHIFYRPDALPAAQPTVSKHWSQLALVVHKSREKCKSECHREHHTNNNHLQFNSFLQNFLLWIKLCSLIFHQSD